MKSATINRIFSIDILRGLVMIIMAIDHTRDFFHSTAMTADPLNEQTTTAALFFTRWITHFCAPIFVLLSGLSAYLSSQNKKIYEASAFMIKRGLWLVFVELTIVTLGLTFNPFYNFIILQVIWAIGWSMIILGLMIRLSYTTILITSLILVLCHNIFDFISLPPTGVAHTVVTLLFKGNSVFALSSNHVIGDFYAVIPWTGVMLLGYSLGPWFAKEFDREKRQRLLLLAGSLLIVVFVVLRLTRIYGDPQEWKPGEHGLLSFLNTSKYPPSLQYCCMTVGPALILLALFEKIQWGWTKVVSVYGRVPFFYYILHFYILHTVLVAVFYLSGHSSSQIADPQSPFAFRPIHFGYGLPVVYLIWLCVVAALYLPCRWFNQYKLTHSDWWLKYV